MSNSDRSASEATVIPVLPLRGAVLFPGSVLPFEVARPKTVALAEMLAKVGEANQTAEGPLVFVVAQKSPTTTDPALDDLHPVGTIARTLASAKQENGHYAILVQGIRRARLSELTEAVPFLRGQVEPLESTETRDEELEALLLSLQGLTRELAQQVGNVPRDVLARLEATEDAGAFADLVATLVDAPVEEKAVVLATTEVKERVRLVLRLATRRLEVLKMRQRIDTQVRDEIGKTQREHVLRQQMKAIKEELDGGGDNEEGDLDDLEKRVAEAKLSDEAREVAKKQLKRLRAMQTQSPEYAMVRTYLDWLIDLPWQTASADKLDLSEVRAVLEAEHYGLQKVKKRVLEFLAVRKLKNDKKGPILCLIGPPGVGKTSLAKSVAGALGRKLQRLSLGGVHDEAAIRGHRRTYIGALPGQIIQAMKKAGTTNPVLVLDEVDKVGQSVRGDVSSALLEVLDPEQNSTFADHYIEVPYDLSNVMFIATANQASTIPAPLRDRMEIIEIPGYTRREKLEIAKRHLVPKQLKEHGISAEQLELTDDALELVIDRYTREAGVRLLEQQLAAVLRGIVVQIAEGREDKRVVATEDDVRAFLGPVRFISEVAERTEDAGVATGLAWTPVGGEILFVEATEMRGSGKLVLTGQLGDVMKESAQAALSFIRAGADRYGIARDFLEKRDIHVHVPAGGMPKDGPSAGVTMLTALVSVLTGIRVRHDVAMTGEITLRGRVLPIGGLKEKVLAAHRAGIKRVIVPERNRFDLEEVPDEVKSSLEFVFVSRLDEVLAAALEEKPRARRAPDRSPAAAAPPAL